MPKPLRPELQLLQKEQEPLLEWPLRTKLRVELYLDEFANVRFQPVQAMEEVNPFRQDPKPNIRPNPV